MIRRLGSFHAALAAVLALAAVVVGLTWSTRVAAGADAYGYVSQVDLWRHGTLHIDQSFGGSVPWPMARWTFTPLGYRPEPDGYRIVPVYAAGYPLLMLAARLIAGACAMFWVVPICGGVLVFATYAIGRRIGRPIVGLAAAWIVATSPAMLFMLVAPMSDVPAAAAWTVAIACLLAETPASAAVSGAAAAVAILVRPNLAPLAGVLAVWIAWRDRTGTLRGRRGAAAPWFIAPAALGAIAVGALNARLYGSPLASGYDLTDAYSLAYLWPNVQRYVSWLVSAETPLALAGLLALVVPSATIWRARESRAALPLFAAFSTLVWISYLLYVPWDAWWYLRFLLPAWPLMAIGTASLLASLHRLRAPVWRAVALGALAVVGLSGIWQAVRRDAFSVVRGESRYIEVARTVESLTAPDDVIICAQHSGSIRYYAGRLTLRWDVGDPAWLDRTVAWLAAHGHHPYLVLEDQEIAELRARDGATNAVARVDWMPLVSFRGGVVKMYDAVRRERTAPPVQQAESRPTRECPRPRPAPTLRESAGGRTEGR